MYIYIHIEIDTKKHEQINIYIYIYMYVRPMYSPTPPFDPEIPRGYLEPRGSSPVRHGASASTGIFRDLWGSTAFHSPSAGMRRGCSSFSVFQDVSFLCAKYRHCPKSLRF